MLKGDWPRWLYAFTLLFITVGWAAYVLQVLRWTSNEPNIGRILELSGASGVMATLLTLLTLTVQFFFRKAPPSLPSPGRTPAPPAQPPAPPGG